MIQYIEKLPKKEQQSFDENELPELLDMFEKTFSCLSLAYVTASTAEPELISFKTEDTREALSWMDEILFELRQRKEVFEFQKLPNRKSDRSKPQNSPKDEK